MDSRNCQTATVTPVEPGVYLICNQGMKPRVMSVGRRPQPTDDFTPLVDQQTEFTADDPPMIGEPLATDLGWAPSFANWMDQFDTLTVHHPRPYKCRFFHGAPAGSANGRQPEERGTAGQGSGWPRPRGND